MPLNSGCSVKAFEDNISKLIEEGRPRDQAVAAAFDKLESSCKEQGKPVPDVGEAVEPEDKKEKASVPRTTAVWGVFDYLDDLK